MSDSRDMREEFRPTAAEYRQVNRLLMMSYLVFIPVGVLLLWKSPEFRVIGVAGFALCIAGPMIGAYAWLPKLTCPGCQQRMDPSASFLGRSSIGNFCPECGQAAVKRGWFYPKCTACGKALTQGRNGRQYKIRFCTWCGVRVDDEGL